MAPDVNLGTIVAVTVQADAPDADRPDWRDPESRAMEGIWQTCRDAYDGTDAMLARPKRYLPKHRKEKPEDYRARCEHSAVFNTYAATVNGLTGLAFAKEPTLGKDVPAAIREHAENIDGAGTTLGNFARELTEDGIAVGTSGFMVLYPPRPAGATAEAEINGTLRPYWRRIRVEDVYSWDHATVGAREMLTQLVVREQVRRRAGRFGYETVTHYREFRHDVTGPLGLKEPVTYIVWEERQTDRKKRSELVPVSTGFIVNGRGESLSRIPYVGVLMGRRVNKMFGRPLLKDLLDLMLKAFRIDSDRSYLMHLACVPIPLRKGYQSPARVAAIGDAQGNVAQIARATGGAVAAPNVLMDLPADTPQASGIDFRWVEIQGTAFAPTKDELEKLKAEMGALGLQFLAPSTRAAETEGARRLDARIENATLSSLLSRVESAIEEGQILHAEYLGLDATVFGEQSGGSFTCNRDFERTVLSEAMIKVYSDLVMAEQLTLETFLELLRQGRALPDGVSIEQEIGRLRGLLFDRHTRELAALKDRQATATDTPPTGDQLPASAAPPPLAA